MDQSLLRKPIYSKLLALYDNYDVSKVIILFISNTKEWTLSSSGVHIKERTFELVLLNKKRYSKSNQVDTSRRDNYDVSKVIILFISNTRE